MTIEDVYIKNVSRNVSNFLYEDNYEATKQLMELFDRIAKKPINRWEEYVDMYDDNIYTYLTWEELVKSEVEQGLYGMTEEECKEQLDKTIWQLPCGWYVQRV